MRLVKREIRILLHHPIYVLCMVVLPLFMTVFFTSLMSEGQPLSMPVGIVDLDQTSTTRKLTRMLDGMQNSRVVAHYQSEAEARHAMQQGEIYGFLLFPQELTHDLLSGRQPKMSLYYSNTSLTAGALLYKDMKTVCMLGSAAVGSATMKAHGYTDKQVMAFLQPISIDTHTVGNPWVSYNIYLSTMLVPGSFLLFVFLLTAYSLGTETKFNTQGEWLDMAGGNIWKAVACKFFPQTIVFLVVFLLCLSYMFGILRFPAPGGVWRLLLLGALSVVAAQGFALFIFGLVPSLRMSMSICSLWSVLSFSMVGSAFPVFAMDAPLQSLAWLFPLRHYYMIYQLCIFNDYPLHDAMPHILMLLFFALLPLTVIKRIGKYQYIP